MQELTSARMVIHELSADELERTLPIYLSNPAFMQRQEGSEGEPGRYDLARWQRDWSIAQYMPGRHLLVACLKDEQRTAIGLIDYLEQNDDGLPHLGTLIIHKDYQRYGLATEIFRALTHFFRETYRWSVLRASVAQAHPDSDESIMPDPLGVLFLRHLGFRPVVQEPKRWQGVHGRQNVFLFEYQISR